MVANPYEYIAAKMSANESDLKKSLSNVSIAMVLRRYEYIDEYDVNYWNDLIRYFSSEVDEPHYFDTIEAFKAFILGDYKL